MTETRRLFLKKTLISAGGLVAAAYYPMKLTAGGCASATGIAYSGVGISNQKLGNCEMRSLLITLKPGGNGFLQALVGTHFTHSKDVWNIRVQIVSSILATPKQFYTWWDHSFQGPPMSEKDVPLFHNWQETFKFNPQSLNPPAELSAAFMVLTQCC